MRLVWFLLALLALVGFTASTWVHVEALQWRRALALEGGTFSLFFAGIAVVFAPFVLAIAIDRLRGLRNPLEVLGRGWTVALVFVFLYAAGNLAWCAHLLGVGSGGGPIALVTPVQQALALRAFSGAWLLFYFAPLAYFLRRSRLAR